MAMSGEPNDCLTQGWFSNFSKHAEKVHVLEANINLFTKISESRNRLNSKQLKPSITQLGKACKCIQE
jgi:hypothetical protein